MVGFCSPKFYGGLVPQNLYQDDHARSAARHVEKFREVIAPSNKVIGAHTLNLKPNFEFWLSPKNFFGAPQFLNLTYKTTPSSHRLAKFARRLAKGAPRCFP